MADIFTRLLLNTNDFDAKLSKSKKEVGDIEGSFASVGKTAVAGFGAIAGAVGIAYGGMETFNKVVNSSNEMTDTWEATCRSAKSTVDEFFYSLTSGDFTFFNSGIDEMIRKAQIAAGALDQLGNTGMSYGYFNTRNQADFAEAITMLRDKNASSDDKSAATATVKSVMGDQREITTQLRRRVQETMQALVTESNSLKAGNVSLFDVEKVIRLDVSAMGDDQKEKLKRQYEDYNAAALKLKADYTKEIKNGGIFGGGTEFKTDTKALDKAMAPVNAQYQDAILYNTILVKKSDDWLQNLLNIVGAADNAERVVAGMGKTLNRATSSPTGGGGKKTSAKPTEAGSLDYLDEQIKKAQDAVNSATTDAMRTTAQKTLDGLSTQKLKITAELQVSTAPIEGSIDYIDAKFKKLQTDFEAAGTPEARKSLQEQMNSLTVQKTQITDESKGKPAAGSIDYINEQIKDAQTSMSAATSDAARTAAQKLISELENQKIILDIEAKHGPISDMSMDQKIKLDVPTPEVKQYRTALEAVDKTQKKIQRSTNGVASGFDAVGQLMSNIAATTNEDATRWLTWGSNVLSAVGAAIPAIAALTIARKSEATANAAAAGTGVAASVASIPVVGWILAGAAVASIIASFAAIPKFADGGLVGGSSYYGDKILAAVNSGEVILNNKQQRNLVGLMSGNSQSVNITGELQVRGRNLVAVLEKNNKFKQRVK